jgi:hypothetical protein
LSAAFNFGASMVSDRLLHLQTEVQAYYEQLAGKEKARRLAPQEEKIRIQQQIRELQVELGGMERDYWLRWKSEASGLMITDTDAEVLVGDLLPEVESLEFSPLVQANAEMMALLQELKAELTKPGVTGTGKLKATIPLLPGFITYELELDTEGLLRRVFPTFCKLTEKLRGK